MRVLFVNTHYRHPSQYGKLRTSAVDWWRTITPAKSLQKHTDWKVDIQNDLIDPSKNPEEQYINIGKNYDVVISGYHRNGLVLAWMNKINKLYGTKYVMDFDDDVINIPTGNPVHEQYKKMPEEYAKQLAIVDMMPHLIVTNRYLKKVYKRESEASRVHIVPNYIDLSHFPKKRKKSHDTVNIGYMGSISHLMDLVISPFLPAIKQVLNKHKNVRLKIYGTDKYPDFDHPQIEWKMGTSDFTEYSKEFVEWSRDIDIAVAPLLVTHFAKSKSWIKYLEYGSQGIPVVATKIRQYEKTVIPNKTGLLVEDDKDWITALNQLIENESKRKAMGRKIYKDITENYTINTNYQRWIEVIERINEL